MSRLIDADALLEFERFDYEVTGEEHTAKDVLMMIKTAPTIEAEPVIRCKDCKHYKRHKEEIAGQTWMGWCKYGEFHTDDLDFCSRAKMDKEE